MRARKVKVKCLEARPRFDGGTSIPRPSRLGRLRGASRHCLMVVYVLSMFCLYLFVEGDITDKKPFRMVFDSRSGRLGIK